MWMRFDDGRRDWLLNSIQGVESLLKLKKKGGRVEKTGVTYWREGRGRLDTSSPRGYVLLGTRGCSSGPGRRLSPDRFRFCRNPSPEIMKSVFLTTERATVNIAPVFSGNSAIEWRQDSIGSSHMVPRQTIWNPRIIKRFWKYLGFGFKFLFLSLDSHEGVQCRKLSIYRGIGL